MASLNQQKQACRSVVEEHMQALADYAIAANKPEGLKSIFMEMVRSLGSKMTLSELKEWQEHVERKYGKLISDD